MLQLVRGFFDKVHGPDHGISRAPSLAVLRAPTKSVSRWSRGTGDMPARRQVHLVFVEPVHDDASQRRLSLSFRTAACAGRRALTAPAFVNSSRKLYAVAAIIGGVSTSMSGENSPCRAKRSVQPRSCRVPNTSGACDSDNSSSGPATPLHSQPLFHQRVKRDQRLAYGVRAPCRKPVPSARHRVRDTALFRDEVGCYQPQSRWRRVTP